jgi:histidine phosphotransferase
LSASHKSFCASARANALDFPAATLKNLPRFSLHFGESDPYHQGEDLMTTRRVRLAMLGIGLASALMMRSGDVPVNAQESSRGEDAAVKLAGRKVRIDKNSGKLRDLSQQEARELVATLTAMTTQTERAAAVTPGGAPSFR